MIELIRDILLYVVLVAVILDILMIKSNSLKKRYIISNIVCFSSWGIAIFDVILTGQISWIWIFLALVWAVKTMLRKK